MHLSTAGFTSCHLASVLCRVLPVVLSGHERETGAPLTGSLDGHKVCFSMSAFGGKLSLCWEPSRVHHESDRPHPEFCYGAVGC